MNHLRELSLKYSEYFISFVPLQLIVIYGKIWNNIINILQTRKEIPLHVRKSQKVTTEEHESTRDSQMHSYIISHF